MSDINTTWVRFHLAARSASESALLVYWRKVDGNCCNFHSDKAEEQLREAAAILGYDLVKREKEAA